MPAIPSLKKYNINSQGASQADETPKLSARSVE
jgi:hypothetical protein